MPSQAQESPGTLVVVAWQTLQSQLHGTLRRMAAQWEWWQTHLGETQDPSPLRGLRGLLEEGEDLGLDLDLGEGMAGRLEDVIKMI